MPRFASPLAALLLLGCPKTPEKPHQDDTEGPVDTSPPDDTAVLCQEDAVGEIPAEAVWLEVDTSGGLHSLDDGALAPYGSINLNAEEFYGANAFKLAAPGRVVGAKVTWRHILAPDTPAVLTVWPDFSSDGYAYDVWNPYGSFTRCLDPEDEDGEVTYVFPEPISIAQPLHVFAGYHQEEVTEGQDGELFWPNPGIVYQVPVMGGIPDPPVAGARWPNVEASTYYGGMINYFYGFMVSLAVVYDDDLQPGDKPFQIDSALAASSRVAWGDYDGDGDDDLMTNGPTLYRNEGDGTFANVTSAAIPGGTTNWSGGGVWGDYDGDGCLDYFGQGGGYTQGEVLLHNNCDGTFTDTWATSGIDDTQDDRDCNGDDLPEYSPTEGAGWFDYDGDGLLDLYLAEYECSSDYDYYHNYDDRLFHNLGGGIFEDATLAVDIDQSNQAGRGVTPGDYDIDGDVDLFVSNYRLDRNFFYENLGGGVLEEIAGDNGTQGEPVSGAYGHTIGAVFGDIDNDGDFDMIHANLAHPFYYHFSNKTMVLINDGSGQFTDEAAARGIYYRETASNPVLFDADNDGDLDLFITNVYDGRDSDFYENDGDGFFTLRNWESGLVVQNGWGAAAADHDNDGDVDILAYSLFRNDLDSAHHWLQVRAVGTDANTAALGAVIQVEAGGLSQLRMVSGGSGTSSQDSATQHFGLGAADHVDSVTIWFPYQVEPVTIEDVDPDQRLWITADGQIATGWAP